MSEPVWKTHLGSTAFQLNAEYHDTPRAEVIDRLGVEPHCLLDVGCGSGATAQLAKSRFPNCRVIGLEVNPIAAEVAAGRLDQVFRIPFEELDRSTPGYPADEVDCVLLLDVLEHMVDPWRALERLRGLVKPGARIVASIPNIRNLTILDRLARGTWKYQAAGILDVTHLRFFTLREMMRMFNETGYTVVNAFSRPDSQLASIRPPEEGQSIDIGGDVLQLRSMSRQDVIELTTLQFIIQADAPLQP